MSDYAARLRSAARCGALSRADSSAIGAPCVLAAHSPIAPGSTNVILARSLSALLLLALAGCGHTARRHAADPFAYDAARPLAVQQAGVAHPNKLMSVHVLSFAGASGRVDAFVVVPAGTHGRMPAVLFLHGAGGNREDFLIPAALLAQRGVVTMTISQPNDAFDFKPLVVNARRALDLLAARADVDSKRLGLVGYSLGAQTAAILAGDEPDSRRSASSPGGGPTSRPTGSAAPTRSSSSKPGRWTRSCPTSSSSP